MAIFLKKIKNKNYTPKIMGYKIKNINLQKLFKKWHT